MCTKSNNVKWTLMLLFGGVLCRTRNINYERPQMCTVKGSTAVILCSFSYPDKETVQSVMWGRGKNIYKGPFIYASDSNNSDSRFHYIGNKKDNCSLEIHHVEHSDEGKYAFRFITNPSNEKWTGKRGSKLKIVDLNISMTKLKTDKSVQEGDFVNLTCTNSCDGGDLSLVTWFKNGGQLHEGPMLHLRNVSFADSGNYSCSLKSHTRAASGVLHVDVEYGPRNTSVSITPSAETSTATNVTLTCRSRANPAVENYTWFRISDDEISAVGHQPELHLQEDFQGNSDQYFCMATNKHGSHNSSVVLLKMRAVTTDQLAIPLSASVAALLIAITVVICRQWKKPVSQESESENADYVNYPVFDTSQSQEEDHGELEVTYATVNFNLKRKADMAVQREPPDDECIVYSTVQRNQPLGTVGNVMGPKHIQHHFPV